MINNKVSSLLFPDLSHRPMSVLSLDTISLASHAPSYAQSLPHSPSRLNPQNNPHRYDDAHHSRNPHHSSNSLERASFPPSALRVSTMSLPQISALNQAAPSSSMLRNQPIRRRDNADQPIRRRDNAGSAVTAFRYHHRQSQAIEGKNAQIREEEDR